MRPNCPLADRAKQTPNAIAIQKAHQSLTWQELDRLTDRLIADLFGELDPITFQDPDRFKDRNDIRNPIQLPAQKIQKDPQKQQWIAVHQCDPTVTMLLVCLSIRSGIGLFLSSDRDPLEQSNSLIDQLPVVLTLRGIQSISDLFGIKDPAHKMRSKPQDDQGNRGVFSDHKIQKFPAHQPSMDHPRFFLQTSGSTRTPKIVAHSLNTLLASAKASNLNVPFMTDDRWLLSLALWHIGGLAIFFRALSGGGTVCIPDDKTSMAHNVIRHRITHLSVVALQLSRMMAEQNSFPNLKHVLVGGGPIPETLIQIAQSHSIPVHTTYGMTELASQLCTTRTNATDSELKTAGYPLDGWAIKIDPSGEICAKGSALFLGYHSENGLTTTRDSDGWFHTGDLGQINSTGTLTVLGRKDSQFISGGENIYPEEIEKVLTDFPTIRLAVVVPIKCRTYGQRPVAFVLGEYAPIELQEHLRNRLPKFKHPDRIEPWPSQISTHKPSRSALRVLASHCEPPMHQKP